MSRASLATLWTLAAAVTFTCTLPAAADRYQPRITAAEEEKLDRARTLRRADNYRSSVTLLQELLRDNPDYYLASYNLALAYADAGQYPLALAQFEHAEKVQERFGIKDPTLHNSYGWAQLLAGKYDEAEKTFKKAEARFDLLSADSKRRLLNNMGVLYQHKKDYATADRYLKRAAEDYSSTLAQENLRTNQVVQRQAQQAQQVQQQQQQQRVQAIQQPPQTQVQQQMQQRQIANQPQTERRQ